MDLTDVATMPDLIVVGAGAAGLSAAVTVAGSGFSVQIVEARNRIGGRMFTPRDPVWQVPIELGAEFIHGVPPEIWKPLETQCHQVSRFDSFREDGSGPRLSASGECACNVLGLHLTDA
jgi:phytoene dehydrogenase-like protein